MKNVGNYIVYQKDVCKIVDHKQNSFTQLDCYTLVPVKDGSLKLIVPVDNPNIRELMSKQEVENLIENIPKIKMIEQTDKMMETEYKKVLMDATPSDLIRVIKTTYLRNQERVNANRKISDKDNKYFELAEEYLYNEIGVVLGMNFDQTKEYIVNKVSTEKDSLWS